ncbi:MAG: hypothetical protein QOE96_2310 [Blastocatellia bacterium]|jgi:hypothetical protein|nr:hypothetical protein [Blastocatellia bacterium]
MRTHKLTLLITMLMGLAFLAPTASAQSQSSPVFGPETFTRDTGKPQTITREFFVQDPSGSYALVIRSGQNGAGRVTSAVIQVNGVVVAGPSDFNPQTGLTAKGVTLQQQNKISVELRGEPGTFVTLAIQKGSVPAQVTVIDNKTDPLLLEVVDTDGRLTDYFGDRDAEGLATSIYAVRVKSPTGEVSTYFFDEQGRPIRLVASNGVFVEITWLSSGSIAITATAPNGDQIDIPFDFGAQATNHHHVVKPASSGVNSLDLLTRNATTSSNLAGIITQSLNQGQSTSVVTVRHCNEPVNNARVELEVRPERGDAQTYLYKGIGNGAYTVTIPNRDTGGDRQLGNRLCFALTRALDNLCNGLQAFTPAEKGLLCTGLSLGAGLLGVPPPAFELACLIIMSDLDRICPANSLVGEFICEGNRVITNRIARGRLSFNVTATMPGAAFPEFDTLGTAVNGQYPPVTINFPCNCEAGYGKRLVINDNHTNVKITILPFEAAFTDEIWLFNAGQTRLLATNRQVGTVVDVGTFNSGTELVFGIRVLDTGQIFRMGPGYRNPDRYAHDKVQCLADGVKVLFEDNLGLGDKDFDDAVFKITTTH